MSSHIEAGFVAALDLIDRKHHLIPALPKDAIIMVESKAEESLDIITSLKIIEKY